MKNPGRRLAATFCLSLIGTLALRAAESGPADFLRDTYVRGVSLISETDALIGQSNRLLSIVEAGSDENLTQFSSLEQRNEAVRRALEVAEVRAKRAVTEGQQLVSQHTGLERRFATLEKALADQPALLAGAAHSVEALVTAADRSGNFPARKLADQAAEKMKASSARLRQLSDRLAEARWQAKLDQTLLEGLQGRAATQSADIKAVRQEQAGLAELLSLRRVAVDQCSNLLIDSRRKLEERTQAFGRVVESFRVAQADVLSRWLLTGPPAGDLPVFTFNDVLEARSARSPRPAPDQTSLGQGVGGIGTEGLSARGGGDAAGEEGGQVSPEIVQLHQRTKWYLAMLDRLAFFADDSLFEATAWLSRSDVWKRDIADIGHSLADQRGVLTTLRGQVEQVVEATVLVSRQADAIAAQTLATTANLVRKTDELATLTGKLTASTDR